MTEIKPQIRIENLSKSFGKNRAIDNISLSFDGAGPFGIVGPDGAGKTTLMRILAGVMTFQGSINVLGAEYPRESDSAKKNTGYMPQIFGLYQDLSVKENLIFYAELFGMRKEQILGKLPELLEFADLTPFINRPAGKLSGGMKQKLALCSCLIHEPKLLILDEPGAGVDPVSRREFWEILDRLIKQEIMVLVATTYMDEAERCERVIYMQEGEIFADNTVDELKNSYPLKLIEFKSQHLRDLRNILSGIDMFRHINFFGDTVHAAGKFELEEMGIIISRNVAPHISDLAWDAINPQLEDVFVHLGWQEKENAI